jgi:hypothetical protein
MNIAIQLSPPAACCTTGGTYHNAHWLAGDPVAITRASTGITEAGLCLGYADACPPEDAPLTE